MESIANKILTVSIAAYNVEEYLDETLTSCIPAIRNLDVIVVNDGSKDGTLEVAKSGRAGIQTRFVSLTNRMGDTARQ